MFLVEFTSYQGTQKLSVVVTVKNYVSDSNYFPPN